MILASAVRSRDKKVFAEIVRFGWQSIRKIAKATGLTKDSVARSIGAMTKRNRHPESHLWETEEGQAWLHRLVIAAIYEFGLQGNQGAERMSAFFKRIRIDTHVGVSPTALRNQTHLIEDYLTAYQQEQEQKMREICEKGKKIDITASGDETFFNEKMLLVLIEMASGYLIMEEEADDRSYKTWEAKAQSRLRQLGLNVRHFISDRGKSLIKLATSGFGCGSGADIFHAQFDISKWLGRALYGKSGRTCKQLKEC